MPAGGEVEIGWWPTARLAELQSFIDREYRRGHVLASDAELLRWQHPRSADELAIVGATSGGELLGILGVIPVSLCVHGRRANGGWLTTWVVTSPWRRHQLGLRLLAFVSEHHDFVGTLGGNQTTVGILEALRFHVRRFVPRWILPLTAGGCARLIGRNRTVGLPFVAGAATAAGGGCVRAWSREIANDWDEVWRERLARQLVGTWRDADYVRWRYVEHPRFRYRVRVALGGDRRPSALLAYRLEAVRGIDAVVCRVVEALGEAQGLEHLARRLGREGREAGAAFADFYCTSNRYATGLERAGFIRDDALAVAFPSRFQPLEAAPRPLTAAFKLRACAEDADLFAGDDVYFTRSDGDQDRPS